MSEKLPDEAISFFQLFSRLEYSLKVGGFVCARSAHDPAAVADWDRLADSELGAAFWDAVTKDTKLTILDAPPRKQVFQEGSLGWVDVEPANDTKTLLRALRRVRNNLFHGGKYSGYDNDAGRNRVLLVEASSILTSILDHVPSLRAIFDDRL